VIAISAKTGATRDIAESLAMHDPRGAIVVGVEENGPAAKAGLKNGDVISSAGGEPIKGASELTKKIHAIAPGSTELTVLRQGRDGGRRPDQSSSPAPTQESVRLLTDPRRAACVGSQSA
jgi:serine protease Do